MKVVILQSNYIPWKGYFDLLRHADTFVFHDDLQYTKQDWRNRNKIKTPTGPQWLTIPVGNDEHRLICDVALPADGRWQREHLAKIENAYRGQCPHYDLYADLLEALYKKNYATLSEFNQTAIQRIARDHLGIKHVQFLDSRTLGLTEKKQARVMQILEKVKATHYLSGPAAKAYLEPEAFKKANVKLSYIRYQYAPYAQPHGEFSHEVSVLDTLFCVPPAEIAARTTSRLDLQSAA